MCQVNTDPMRSRKGYLQVVGKLQKAFLCLKCFWMTLFCLFSVPPVILESVTSNDLVVREGTNVTLTCKAKGFPEPYVMWRREDGNEMSIGGENGIGKHFKSSQFPSISIFLSFFIPLFFACRLWTQQWMWLMEKYCQLPKWVDCIWQHIYAWHQMEFHRQYRNVCN